jgi:putative membrane protein
MMKRVPHRVALLTVALLAVACDPTKPKTGEGVAAWQAPDTAVVTADAPVSVLTSSERLFIAEAACSGLFEDEGGQMAALKGSLPKVRALGAMLVAQHRAAQAELQRLAGLHGITLPNSVDAARRNTLDRLSQLSGTAFDRAFIRTVGVADPEAAITKFTAIGGDIQDPQLKAWIDNTLSTLHHQLQTAQQSASAARTR